MEETKTWNSVFLNIDWRADRHSESHVIEFQRPTADNPSPEAPVVRGKVLSYARLPMSSEWGGLFPDIRVKAFDEHSLTIIYGTQEMVLTPECGAVRLGEEGMSYTSFELYIWLKEVPHALQVTHDEAFLRRFRIMDRIYKLTDSDIDVLREQAEQGDAFAQYAYGRWLYAQDASYATFREAERLFLAAKDKVPDALAAYALMMHYGETSDNKMNIEESDRLLQEAIQRGSVRAAMQRTRFRIYGLFCEQENEVPAAEMEQRLREEEDPDPYWHILLAFAYEKMERQEDAIEQYEKAIARGELDAYYFLAYLYFVRGNTALYEEMMEEGIQKGCALCCSYRSDMEDEAFRELPEEEQHRIHREADEQLHLGLERGDGACAYFLWWQYYYGELGFPEDKQKSYEYLKRGARLAYTNCFIKMASLAEEGTWPESLTKAEIGELWLRAARYAPLNDEALRGLSSVDDPAFLQLHEDELERYWRPRFPQETSAEETETEDEDEVVARKPERTPIEPTVIVIWPTGHMDLVEADVYKMKSYREMAETLIGAEGLDAVHYSMLLYIIGEAAELKMSLVMYCDRDAQMKGLPDNAIGTQLYGTGQEIRGPIIICQEDRVHDCHSFKTLEELTTTYEEIDKHCGGLLVVKEEDDGRYDAYV